ncbi:cobalt-precorrin-6A reductase [Rhodocyclus tenuis]|uniref:Cobalt-precorrin-6A reductase n=1 Tax=Rhodocyclus gracilis TaxID=2929842 RepID=A0ABX0WJ73_9RHOO|nr:cobalt-precorrin-6A reductase [Rhodocyclus gracilis]NJA89772.1 cobalt-precorrin-6A reductase [Rhodocyclus gracilis]
MTPPEPTASPADFSLLILGGTSEAYQLAADLHGRADTGLRVISSLAGRTAQPRLPAGESRVGGFGGVAGLTAYLRAEHIDAVIDATHPFAGQMRWNAADACAAAGVPLLRLERPAWRAAPGDHWLEIDNWDEAVAHLAASVPATRRVLLALGRQELAPFAALDHCHFVIRSVDAPDPQPPFAHAELVLARGPFSLADERELLLSHAIDTIVCKNSGGGATDAKLAAARELGVRVLMRRRPPQPDSPSVASVAAAMQWVAARAGK